MSSLCPETMGCSLSEVIRDNLAMKRSWRFIKHIFLDRTQAKESQILMGFPFYVKYLGGCIPCSHNVDACERAVEI